MSAVFPFADLALSRRLERAESVANAHFIETRARLEPGSNATWMDVKGTYAMFDGPGSPLTQTFGLGLFEEITSGDIERLEVFFRERGASVHHEVSPLAGVSLAAMLVGCGYVPIEYTTVMCRPLGQGTGISGAAASPVTVRMVGPDEAALFASTAEVGWSEFPEVAPFVVGLSTTLANQPGALCFLAEVNGVPIASGALNVHEGVALMAGASTVPEGRRQGAQLALLEARLTAAAARGCDLAMMCAAPGSASQRNAERHGFRIAYTRTKWQLSD